MPAPRLEVFDSAIALDGTPQALVEVTADSGERESLRLQLMALEQKIALRLESLRLHGL